MRVEVRDGTVVVVEGDEAKPVLRYIHAVQAPSEGLLETIALGNRKYAQPRADYIHPLWGPHGEVLTTDWAVDHPHHRGLYWAWPEVQWQGRTGDLHALQQVFARPVRPVSEARIVKGVAHLTAEHRWVWEDGEILVHETVGIRAASADAQGRVLDLDLRFDALAEGVTLARRGTDKYGGLNFRLAPAAGLRLFHHADPEGSHPRMAWCGAEGTWAPASEPTTVVVLEHPDNPDYPADYIEYANLPWFQPTFPRAGTRFALTPGEPLVLRYRLWITAGTAPNEAELRETWRAFADQPLHRNLP